MDPRISDLEETVVDAWPPAEAEELDGWLLRASGGPTHRGNSVATLQAGSTYTLPARIEAAEAFYRARNLPPMFQLGPCAAPKGLDQDLAERGYRLEGEAVTAVASPVEVLERLPRSVETSVATRPSDAWLELSGEAGRFAQSVDVWRGFLARLGTRCRFATARDARGQAIAACLAISSEDRLGVYAMLTRPEARRKGAGAALLRALAESALAERMRELYLLVETSNTTARALYARAGFVDVYSYHYRVLDAVAATATVSPDSPEAS